jgi:hypothetical protein
MVIRDRETNKIIGRVVTNQSLTFDRAMELAGFEYRANEGEGGWTKNGRTFYDESSAKMDFDTP